MARYVILGTGAVGGSIGARLAQAGVDVVFMARGAHAEALRDNGLTLLTPDETFTVKAPVWTGPADADLHVDDVLVIATKTQHAQAVLADWADLPVRGAPTGATAGEVLPWVMATNGVASEDLALRYVRRVFGLCIWLPAVQFTPGHVVARFTPVTGVLHIGRYPAALTTDADRELLARLHSDWERSFLTVYRPDDVMAWKYRKLLGNLNNGFEALLGHVDYAHLMAAADAEARQVFDAAGITYTDDASESALRKVGPRFASVPGVPKEQIGSSTWQSMVKASGSVETDYIHGEIVYLAATIGIDAPINRCLAGLARKASAQGLAPGWLSVADLQELLGL